MQSAQNSSPGGFLRASLNTKRTPAENAALSSRRESQDLHCGIAAKQNIAKGKALVGFIQRDD
jgi:hypothetical protein